MWIVLGIVVIYSGAFLACSKSRKKNAKVDQLITGVYQSKYS